MAKAKAGQKRQQQRQQQSNTIKNKKHKSTLPEPNITHEQDSVIQDNEENDLFANLDEEMDSNKLDDIVQQLEAESSSSSDEDEDDNESEEDEEDVEDMSEDEQQSQSSQEEEEEEEEEERIKKPTMKPKFRDHYMGQITRAFGSDLDKIRQEPTFSVSQLPILINSLESGIDIFSNLEQEIILADAIQE
ncbi:hypothetical protein BDC45DRAFT_493154 [Circinella umbellata]|nr:hypothetical protein BDC45DRAFT_493154 [Circinella umbellata]